MKFFIDGMVNGASIHIAIPEGGLLLGRSHVCDMAVNDAEVSRQHCRLRVADDKLEVEDFSTNGTFVNGYRINGPTVLMPDDVLRIGNQAFDICSNEMHKLDVGDELCGYRIEQKIGNGGMGTVYAVRLLAANERYAMKVLTLPKSGDREALREKFMVEYRVLSRLQHGNITQVHYAAYDRETDVLFFVMDLVLYEDGQPYTLSDLATYDECDLDGWFKQLASALDYIHCRGVVHSDVKPENVLLTAGRNVKLTDFGVSYLLPSKMNKDISSSITVSTMRLVGYTRHYGAPEVVKRGAEPSVASDVYSLGVMFLRLLTGKWYDENPEAIDDVDTKFKLNWRSVLLKMLCDDAHMREVNLSKLVQLLHEKTHLTVRYQYQKEFHRRANRRYGLKRITPGSIGKIRIYKPISTSLSERIVRGTLLLSFVLTLTITLLAAIKGFVGYTPPAIPPTESREAQDFPPGLLQAYSSCTGMSEKLEQEFFERRRFCEDEIGEINDFYKNDSGLEIFAERLWNERANELGAVLRDTHEKYEEFENVLKKVKEYWEDDDVSGLKNCASRLRRIDLTSIDVAGCTNRIRQKFESAQRLRLCAVNKRKQLVGELRKFDCEKARDCLRKGDKKIKDNADFTQATNDYANGCACAVEARKKHEEKLKNLEELQKRWMDNIENMKSNIDDFKEGRILLKDLTNDVIKCRSNVLKDFKPELGDVKRDDVTQVFDAVLYCLDVIKSWMKKKGNCTSKDVIFEIDHISREIRWNDIVYPKSSPDPFRVKFRKDWEAQKAKMLNDRKFALGMKILEGKSEFRSPIAAKIKGYKDIVSKLDEDLLYFPKVASTKSCGRHQFYYENVNNGFHGWGKVKGDTLHVCSNYEVKPLYTTDFPEKLDRSNSTVGWQNQKVSVKCDQFYRTRNHHSRIDHVHQYKGHFEIGLEKGPLSWIRYKKYED